MKLLQAKDLTKDQKKALTAVRKFLKGPDRCMCLSGAAGTGKSSLMNVLLHELDRKKVKTICCAPTNKAVGVLAKHTGRNYTQTIYSLLGLVLEEQGDEPPKIRQKGSPKIGGYRLVVVDEASMVSRELMAYIKDELSDSPKTRVLFVGDSCQLPPVDDTRQGYEDSVAFDFPLRANLDKVVRVSDVNPILEVVTAIRQDMRSRYDLFRHETKLNGDAGITFTSSSDEFLSMMLAKFNTREYRADPDYAIALAYTNRRVDALNAYIRGAIYGKDAPGYLPGEIVRVKDTYKKTKGEQTVIICSMEDRLRIDGCQPCEIDGIPCYNLYMYPVDGGEPIRASAVAPTRDGQMRYKAKRDALARAAKDNIAGGMGRGQAWSPYFRFKEKFISLGYVYALTVHKSQGSTIRNVFVDETDIDWVDDDLMRNRLKYTAFTRASERLTVLSHPD